MTDHRINLTLYKQPAKLAGEAIAEVHAPLITAHTAHLLAAVAATVS